MCIVLGVIYYIFCKTVVLVRCFGLQQSLLTRDLHQNEIVRGERVDKDDKRVKICTGEDWVQIRENWRCKVHNEVFSDGQWCSHYTPPHPLISTGKQKKAISVVSSSPLTVSPLTVRQELALKLRSEGWSFSRLGKHFGIAKQSAQDLVRRASRNWEFSKPTPLTPPDDFGVVCPDGGEKEPSLTIRLHNDEFKIQILCDYSSLGGELKNVGRNLEYKLFRTADWHIKIHKNSTMTVRFLLDLVAETETKAKEMADVRIGEFVDLFSFNGIQIVDRAHLINRHYGILGTSFAKKVCESKRQVIVRDPDGRVRIKVDFSGKKPEIDAEHTQKGLADTVATKNYMEDIINKPHFLPSEEKAIITRMLEYQNRNNQLIEAVTKNQMVFAENQLSHVKAVQDLGAGGRELTKKVSELNRVAGRKKYANRKKSAKSLLKKYGW